MIDITVNANNLNINAFPTYLQIGTEKTSILTMHREMKVIFVWDKIPRKSKVLFTAPSMAECRQFLTLY